MAPGRRARPKQSSDQVMLEMHHCAEDSVASLRPMGVAERNSALTMLVSSRYRGWGVEAGGVIPANLRMDLGFRWTARVEAG